MNKLSSSLVVLCIVVSFLLFVSTQDGEAALAIPHCPNRPDCPRARAAKEPFRTWRSQVITNSLLAGKRNFYPVPLLKAQKKGKHLRVQDIEVPGIAVHLSFHFDSPGVRA